MASLGVAIAADDKPAPYVPKLGEFPPEASAHAISGELIQMDHVNRTGQLRPDRRDEQRTDDYDRGMPFTLLPYGTIRYHGAPAELRDIPIGTHLHGQFFWKPGIGKDAKGAYTSAMSLEDDFSFCQSRQRAWRLDAVNLDKASITVTGFSLADNKADASPTVFKLNPATRVWKAHGIGVLADLAPGQMLQLNWTEATLKGPGRITDVWLDEESQKIASTQQIEVHRAFQKTRGLAGWIDDVDNDKGLVTLTLFGGFDPALKADLKPKSRIALLVAEESLRTYDQINDRMYCDVVEIREAPPAFGSSRMQFVVKPENLLEGFRPRRIVRVLAGSWPLDDIPWEERLYPADNRLK